VGEWNERFSQWDWIDLDGHMLVHHDWVDEIYKRLEDVGERSLSKSKKVRRTVTDDQAAWYSETRAALDLGWIHTFHQHCPVGGKTDGSGPWCCAQPMQWTEPGWRCRVRKETIVQAVSDAVWVLWGLQRTTNELSQLHRGLYESCKHAQPGWAADGWITGPYREGFEPKALLLIQSNRLLDNDRQVSETEPMTSTIGQREATNRAIKATAILAVLDGFSLSADEVERLDDAGWQAAAQLAAKRQNPPAEWIDASPTTRATVIGTLRQREATPNEFEGFPQ
jgi:hypothetical protein